METNNKTTSQCYLYILGQKIENVLKKLQGVAEIENIEDFGNGAFSMNTKSQKDEDGQDVTIQIQVSKHYDGSKEFARIKFSSITSVMSGKHIRSIKEYLGMAEYYISEDCREAIVKTTDF